MPDVSFPTLLDIVQQLDRRLPPPIVDITLKVIKFRDLLVRGSGAPATTHELFLRSVHPNVKLGTIPLAKKAIKVTNDGATLRFSMVEGENHAPAPYNAIAVTFARDQPEPRAIYFNDGHQTGAYTPFSALRLNGPIFQFTNTIVGGRKQLEIQEKSAPPKAETTPEKSASVEPTEQARPKPGKWFTYKFSVIIQRQSDGAIGIIDPYIENENGPQVMENIN